MSFSRQADEGSCSSSYLLAVRLSCSLQVVSNRRKKPASRTRKEKQAHGPGSSLFSEHSVLNVRLQRRRLRRGRGFRIRRRYLDNFFETGRSEQKRSKLINIALPILLLPRRINQRGDSTIQAPLSLRVWSWKPCAMANSGRRVYFD